VAQELIAQGTTSHGTMTYSLDGQSFTTKIPAATDAGDYTVYYKICGDENHLDMEPERITISIAKAAPYIEAPKGKELTYSGEPQALISQGYAVGGTMVYSLNGEDFSADIPTATNAGDYTIYYKVLGDANHLDSEVYTVTASIARIAAGFTAPIAQQLNYIGKAQALLTAGASDGGTMMYSLDGENFSAEIPAETDAGDYIVYYKVFGNANHLDSGVQNLTVSISKSAPTLDAPTANKLTYSGKAQALISAGMVTGGTMVYSLDGNNFSTEIPTATNAGNYTIYYKVLGDDNHLDSEIQNLTVSIAKSALTFNAPTANKLTYSGAAQALISAGTAVGGAMVYSLDGSNFSASIPVATGAGDYTIYYKIVGDANHLDSEVQAISAKIAKAAASLTAPIGQKLTYIGKAQALISAGTATGGAMVYSVNGGDFSAEIPTATNAGTYAVRYKVLGDANHLDSETNQTTISIAKTTPEYDAPTANDLIYSGSAQALVSSGNTGDGTLVYSLDGQNFSEKVPTGTEKGDYTVYYKVLGDQNHLDSEMQEVSVNIAELPFEDVDTQAWYYEAVAYVRSAALMNGYGDGSFGPEDKMTRGQLAQLLYNWAERPEVQDPPTFSDVQENVWFYSAVSWAAQEGIAYGYGNGSFGADEAITREAMVVMLWRFAGSPESESDTLDFPDADQISPWARTALCWAAENGIIHGYDDGRLMPQETASRAEVAQILSNESAAILAK
jgi:methionine-rich copper-binding protein CopC